MKALTLKWGLSLALIIAPVFLLVWQNISGIFTLNIGAYDKPIFSIIMACLIACGFALQGDGGRQMVKYLVLSLAFLIGLPLIVSGLLVVNDAVNSTSVTGSLGVWFAMDTIAAQVAEWTVVVNMIVALIPVAVIVIGVIMIFAADSPDEYGTAILEILIVIGIMVFACLAFGWLGIQIF